VEDLSHYGRSDRWSYHTEELDGRSERLSVVARSTRFFEFEDQRYTRRGSFK